MKKKRKESHLDTCGPPQIPIYKDTQRPPKPWILRGTCMPEQSRRGDVGGLTEAPLTGSAEC